ncbi:unnamed protein product [Meganyctiphanes norvegica]|uniref:Cuticle protein n=1 Tax=Meganyctiphanes norvegica TaxID=48144 RepID=A0AAV2R9N0_MEGNR
MNIFFILVVVGVAQCSPLLKDLPANAELKYEYDGNRLVGIKIDYSDDKVVYTATPAPAAPAPTEPAVITYNAPAAIPASAASASVPTYYEVDDSDEIDVATHVVYYAPGSSPVLYSLPTAPSPSPVVYSVPTQYYTYDSDEDDK